MSNASAEIAVARHPHPEQRRTLTVEEFAKLAGIHRGGAYEGVRRGTIPHVRIGRRILIPTDALDRMLVRTGEAA